MATAKKIGKREFIQHTSKYLKWVELHDKELVITHHNQPELVITKIKPISIKALRNIATIHVHGDINEPVLPGYETW